MHLQRQFMGQLSERQMLHIFHTIVNSGNEINC